MSIHAARYRVIWLCKTSLSYRSKPEFDEDDLYATGVLREELGQHLKLFCQELRELMQWFIDTLRQMRHEIDWIEREAKNIWPLFENEYRIWVQIACDGQAADQDWRAPGWLDKWPAALPPETLLSAARGGRLDAKRTAEVLELVANGIKAPMEQAQNSALNNLRIRFAQEKEAARQAASATDVKAAANAKSKSCEPIEDARTNSEVAKDSIGIVEPKAKRGPKANMKFHHEVAEIVNSFRFGAKWKELSNLEQIAEKMDRRKLPALGAWAKRERRARTWKRAVEFYPDVVRKALEYSLEMAPKDIPEKPSETLGNLR